MYSFSILVLVDWWLFPESPCSSPTQFWCYKPLLFLKVILLKYTKVLDPFLLVLGLSHIPYSLSGWSHPNSYFPLLKKKKKSKSPVLFQQYQPLSSWSCPLSLLHEASTPAPLDLISARFSVFLIYLMLMLLCCALLPDPLTVSVNPTRNVNVTLNFIENR